MKYVVMCDIDILPDQFSLW